MNKVSKEDLVYSLGRVIKVPKKTIETVLDCYVNRLKSQLGSGKTIRFLNICYLVNNCGVGECDNYYETLAFISSEIGSETKFGKELVFRILSTYEDMIVEDLRKFYSYGVRGLVKFRLVEYTSGVYKVRVNKGTNLDSNIRVVTLNSFKRKVELYDWKNS